MTPRDALAKVIAEVMAPGGPTWAEKADVTRAEYLAVADAILALGWTPPGAVEREREACAKVAHILGRKAALVAQDKIAQDIAAAIRARKDNA